MGVAGEVVADFIAVILTKIAGTYFRCASALGG